MTRARRCHVYCQFKKEIIDTLVTTHVFDRATNRLYSAYALGCAYCSVCERFFNIKDIYCQCCGTSLRRGPRMANHKRRVRTVRKTLREQEKQRILKGLNRSDNQDNNNTPLLPIPINVPNVTPSTEGESTIPTSMKSIQGIVELS